MDLLLCYVDEVSEWILVTVGLSTIELFSRHPSIASLVSYLAASSGLSLATAADRSSSPPLKMYLSLDRAMVVAALWLKRGTTDEGV